MQLHLLYAILILAIKSEKLMASSQKCPTLPKSGLRNSLCSKKNECELDIDCSSDEICCENNCGVLFCYKIDKQPEEKFETCPIAREYENREKCIKEPTLFCFKGNCSRCCRHSFTCNPYPSELDKSSKCFTEICSKFNCQRQGKTCIVDSNTLDPFCTCIQKCPATNSSYRICATVNGNREKTFLNECEMNKEACEKETNYTLKHKGICLPIKNTKKPYVKPNTTFSIYKIPIGRGKRIRCYADKRGTKLRWIQKRLDNSNVPVSNTFVEPGRKGIEWIEYTLHFKSFTSASVGEYTCEQTFNKKIYKKTVYVLPYEEELFELSWCKLRKDEGHCKGQYKNYYFDSDEGKCKFFIYKGCGGNQNNFQTKLECQLRCKGEKINKALVLPIHHGVKCGHQSCAYYSECKENQCKCNNRCSFEKDQVCGSDGKTYNNHCIMKSIACRYGKPLFVVYKGECREAKIVAEEKSLCEIFRCPPYAKCLVNELTRSPQCYCETKCTFRPDEICASDMNNYTNECFMKIRSCQLNRKLTVLKRGRCIPEQRRKKKIT